MEFSRTDVPMVNDFQTVGIVGTPHVEIEKGLTDHHCLRDAIGDISNANLAVVKKDPVGNFCITYERLDAGFGIVNTAGTRKIRTRNALVDSLGVCNMFGNSRRRALKFRNVISAGRVVGHDSDRPRSIDVNLVVNVLLFEKGQYVRRPHRLSWKRVTGREVLMGCFVVRERRHNLLDIIHALRSSARFADGLNCRQQQSDQDADHCNNNQQLN